MNIFDIILVQPIFNLLMAIYGIIPGADFGIALIIFTVIVRLVMWPLVKKQLHQTRLMQKLQPEIKKIKKESNGDKKEEARLMMELYRERGVSPFGTIGLLLVQLPIFIALFHVIRIMTDHRADAAKYTYDFLEGLPHLENILVDSGTHFDATLLDFINLSERAVQNGHISVVLLILAVIASVLQFIQSKQLAPQGTEKKRLRDVLRDSMSGKEVDQAEISAMMSQRLMKIFPIMMFFIAIYLPGALVLYYAISSAVAIIQQRILLAKDVDDMEKIADKDDKPKVSPKQSQREKTATEAEVVNTPTTKKTSNSKQTEVAKKVTSKPPTKGRARTTTTVRRIKASDSKKGK